jgi:hypothetical protein
MSKTVVTKLFVGSLIALIGGSVLLLVAMMVGAANGAFIMDGPDVIGIRPAGSTIAVAALIVTAMLAIVGGILGQFVAWIGAVVNTAQFQDKTWFLVLLLLGLMSFGFVAMLAYIWAGPDGAAASKGADAGPATSTAQA